MERGAPPAPGGIPAYGVGVENPPNAADAFTYETGEIITTAVLYAILFFDLIAMLYAVVASRNYRPLRAKQPYVMLVSVFAGICMVSGVNLANRVFPVFPGVPVGLCIFVNVWLYTFFGIAMFAATYFFRLWRIFVVFYKKRVSERWRSLYIMPALFLIPGFLNALIVTVLGWSNLHYADNGVDIVCISYDPFVYFSFAVSILEIIMLALLSFSLRKVPIKYFNDYRVTNISMLISVVVWAASFGVTLSGSQYEVWGRCLVSALYVLILNATLALNIGPSIHYSIFDREGYLARFDAEMRMSSIGSGDVPQGSGSNSKPKKTAGVSSSDEPVYQGSIDAAMVMRELSTLTGGNDSNEGKKQGGELERVFETDENGEPFIEEGAGSTEENV